VDPFSPCAAATAQAVPIDTGADAVDALAPQTQAPPMPLIRYDVFVATARRGRREARPGPRGALESEGYRADRRA
jgi:hypothetical protein